MATVLRKAKVKKISAYAKNQYCKFLPGKDELSVNLPAAANNSVSLHSFIIV
jgi:hypothetical protein